MRGIAGIISSIPLSSAHYEQLHRMSAAMIHRGPDGAGLHQRSHAAMAMRRLSIIDLSTGWQPLYNEDKSIALIANREIHNFIELRKELESRGHTFRSKSEPQVLVHLYEEYGADCVLHLRDMFAFALRDERRDRVLLARDRRGEKPLYLSEKKGILYFASELTALPQTGVADFQLDPSAVYQYFHHQYIPEPLTAITGVRRLPVAHRLSVTVRPWAVNEEVYWRTEEAPELDGDPPTLIRAELERVSDLIVRSDVPVGMALSGGLDSAAIAALASKAYPDQLRAFTVGSQGHPRYDERRQARETADCLSLPLHEVELGTEDMVRAFPDLVSQADDPISDIASYGYCARMKAARKEGVPVMLLGQGGDERFWEYSWVTEALRQSTRKVGWQTGGSPSLMGYLRLSFPPRGSRGILLDWFLSAGGARSSYQQYRRDCMGPGNRLVFSEASLLFLTTSGVIPAILTDRFRDTNYEAELWGCFTLPHPWPRLDLLFTKLICETYLLENGFALADRLSMASCVELRLSFVDYRLVETMIGLRKARLDHALPPKTWLKSAVKGLFPDGVINRPKRGFQPPASQRSQGVLARYAYRLKTGFLVQTGILRPELANTMSQGIPRNRPPEMLTYSALVLEYWCAGKMGHLPISDAPALGVVKE